MKDLPKFSTHLRAFFSFFGREANGKMCKAWFTALEHLDGRDVKKGLDKVALDARRGRFPCMGDVYESAIASAKSAGRSYSNRPAPVPVSNQIEDKPNDPNFSVVDRLLSDPDFLRKPPHVQKAALKVARALDAMRKEANIKLGDSLRANQQVAEQLVQEVAQR
jgi:hypothetical protein